MHKAIKFAYFYVGLEVMEMKMKVYRFAIQKRDSFNWSGQVVLAKNKKNAWKIIRNYYDSDTFIIEFIARIKEQGIV